MQYAVVKVGGKQYRVKKGDVIEVDRLDVEKDKVMSIDNVFLLVDNEKVRIGRPEIPGVKVKAKVLEHKKGDKIRVGKFKAKVRYRRAVGFRPLFTKLEIQTIEISPSSK